MRTYRLGDKIKAKIYKHKNNATQDETVLTGEVVYIHPKNRFYTLQFDFGEGFCFRESFLIREV